MGDPPSDPRVVTPTCYYNFVKFVSYAKCVLSASKRNKITIVNALLLLLPHFCTYFSLQTLYFLLREAQEYFLPQGVGYPSYATDTIPGRVQEQVTLLTGD